MQVALTIVYAVLVGFSITVIYMGKQYRADTKPTFPLLLWSPNLSSTGNPIGTDPKLTYRELAKTYGHMIYSRLLPTSIIAYTYLPIKMWLINLLLDALATGPMPRHIAFEMDGNRRYARRLGMDGKYGHSAGLKNLFLILEFLLRLRIRCVIVYAFAIDNFKRSQEEVDTVMDRLIELAQQSSMLDKHGVRFNFLGRQELLPPRVQEAFQRAENMTRHNNAVFNICAPYSSQDEITTAVESVIREAINSGELDGSTITEDSINSHLSTSLGGSPPLDIFVRTSGVKRLSGFLLWQCCEDTQIHMVDPCWPELGLFDLVPILLEYQRKVWADKQRQHGK